MPPDDLPDAAALVALHDRLLARPGWPQQDGPVQAPGPWTWIAHNHRCNALLWEEEDLARRTTVGDGEIAANKRAIDRHNQARNDATERLDEALLLALGLVDAASARSDVPTARTPPGARLNSETAGSMADRLSILALKIKALHAQTLRTDVDEAHRQLSQARLQRAIAQRDDLGRCFDDLLRDCRAGRACFKVYRQFKLYNDPAFNPVLAAERARGTVPADGPAAREGSAPAGAGAACKAEQRAT